MIEPMKPGTVMGPKKGNLLIAFTNALANTTVVKGTKNELLIAADNAILSLDIQNLLGAENGTLLQVNTVDNAVQTKLNLKNGSGVTITDNGDGSVTIASTGTYATYKGNWDVDTLSGDTFIFGDTISRDYVDGSGNIYRILFSCFGPGVVNTGPLEDTPYNNINGIADILEVHWIMMTVMWPAGFDADSLTFRF